MSAAEDYTVFNINPRAIIANLTETSVATSLLSGYPDATNTGVEAGVALKVHNGDLVVNTAGAVISGLDVRGSIIINAPNVTIENCKVTFVNYWGVNVKSGVNGTIVENCEINGTGTSPQGVYGIVGQGTFKNNNIYNVENGIAVDGNNTLIEGNYIHDLHASGEPHYDGIQISGGLSNITVRHNTVVNQQTQTSAVYITNDWGPVSNVLVEDNQLIGAGYTVYSDEKGGGSGPQISGVQFLNNKIEAGHWGFTYISNNTVVWQGNTEVGTGKTISVDGKLSAGPVTPPTGLDAPIIADWSSDTGTAGDGITSDSTLALKGTAAANSTVKIFDGSTEIGTTTANGAGSWNYITSVLSNAKHVLTATATNAGGQTSTKSGAVTVTVDTVAPTAPVLSSNALVNTNQVRLSGTAEANSTVTVYDGNTVVGTGTTNSTGAWSITTNALSTGTHALTAKAADAAGNTSGASQSVSSVISGTSPTNPAPNPGNEIESSGVTTLIEKSDKYYLNNSSGTGPTLKFGGRDFIDGTDGTWSPVGAEKTATGYLVAWKEASTGQYTAWNTDSNGNYVSHVNALTGSVSGGSVSSTTSALKSIEKSFQQDLNGDGNIGASSGAAPTSSVDLTTIDKSWSGIVTIKGVADANSQVKLYDGNTSLGTVSTAADGSWSFKTSSAISNTVHTYTAKQLDSAGQVVGTSGNAILGSTSNNELKGTSANDLFTGNGGNDTFFFAANFGNDVIKDFGASSRSHDVIQFSKSVFDNFADVLAHATQVGRDVVISADAGDSVTLKNNKLSAITSNDFHFA